MEIYIILGTMVIANIGIGICFSKMMDVVKDIAKNLIKTPPAKETNDAK